SSGRKFYDPTFLSCTKLLAHITKTHFGFNPGDLDDLVYWADLIDGARYPDATTAVEMKDPATRITLVIEGTADPDFGSRIIPELASRPLAEIAAMPRVRDEFEQLRAQHLDWMEIIRARGELQDGVLFFDVSGENREGFNKFIPYYLFPDAVYTVSVSRSPGRIKIAVGSSPWKTPAKKANLASICERYGGGGHAKVAAISLPPDDLTAAQTIARHIVEELRSAPAS
ncbi:MAG: DHH family phosphoesterase, partial [Terriglobia bacterium]